MGVCVEGRIFGGDVCDHGEEGGEDCYGDLEL